MIFVLVIVECHRHSANRVTHHNYISLVHIVLISNIREVSRVRGASVDMSVSVICMVCIVSCALATNKICTSCEHVITILNFCCTPVFSYIYGLQTRTAPEHNAHVRHIIRLEATYVKGRQTRTVIEHSLNVRHIFRLEATHVKARQTRTMIEHITHGRHIVRLKTAYVKVRQARAARKHTTHIRHISRIKATHINTRQTRAISEHAAHVRYIICFKTTHIKAR